MKRSGQFTSILRQISPQKTTPFIFRTSLKSKRCADREAVSSTQASHTLRQYEALPCIE